MTKERENKSACPTIFKVEKREREREKERIVFDCAQRSRDDGHETVSTPLLLPVPLARYHRQRSQPASTRKGRKKEFSPQNSARPRSPQRFDYSTQREQSSRALCRATRTFVIKIPGTGGGDGAFASGGGDSDAGELMGRIRRATREQQTRDKSKCVVVKGSDDRIFVFLFFFGGGVVFYVVYILRGKSLSSSSSSFFFLFFRSFFLFFLSSFRKTGLTNFCG